MMRAADQFRSSLEEEVEWYRVSLQVCCYPLSNITDHFSRAGNEMGGGGYVCNVCCCCCWGFL